MIIIIIGKTYKLELIKGRDANEKVWDGYIPGFPLPMQSFHHPQGCSVF